MTETLCDSGAVKLKAGANASTSATSIPTTMTDFINQAEALVSTISRYDYVANYGTLEANMKPLLTEITSNLAAIYCIGYDMSGFTSRIEAEDMINVLRDAALRGLSIIRDQKGVAFIK